MSGKQTGSIQASQNYIYGQGPSPLSKSVDAEDLRPGVWGISVSGPARPCKSLGRPHSGALCPSFGVHWIGHIYSRLACPKAMGTATVYHRRHRLLRPSMAFSALCKDRALRAAVSSTSPQPFRAIGRWRKFSGHRGLARAEPELNFPKFMRGAPAIGILLRCAELRLPTR
jgi:hypothetical protein